MTVQEFEALTIWEKFVILELRNILKAIKELKED
jgi:hypothetical protein